MSSENDGEWPDNQTIMVLGISLGFLLLFVIFVLWLRRFLSSRTQQLTVKVLTETSVTTEQKLSPSSCSSDTNVILELSTKISSASKKLTQEVSSELKKSPNAGDATEQVFRGVKGCAQFPEGKEGTGKAADGRPTSSGVDNWETSDYPSQTTATSSMPKWCHRNSENSAVSVMSYMDHIRAPSNVFKFYSEQHLKVEQKISDSFSKREEIFYGQREAKSSFQASPKLETKGGGWKSNSNSLRIDDVEFLTVSKAQPSNQGQDMRTSTSLSIHRSYTPFQSCSLISLKDVCETCSGTLLRWDENHSIDEEMMSLESCTSPYGSKSYRPERSRYRIPLQEKSEGSNNNSAEIIRRTSHSSIYLTKNSPLEKRRESHGHTKDCQFFHETSDSRVGSKSAALIEAGKEQSMDISFGTAIINRHGKGHDDYWDQSKVPRRASKLMYKRCIMDSREASWVDKEKDSPKQEVCTNEISQVTDADSSHGCSRWILNQERNGVW